MNTKISVIMPVYKVERYLHRAVDSILAQTFKEYELILVDDGSPDRSGEICDKYAAVNPAIQVIHKENGGAPSARNVAMEQAGGKYFFFMDSDDWCEPGMLEDLYRLAEENDAQLVVSGFYIDTYYSDTRHITQNQVYRKIAYADQQAFRDEAYRLFDRNLLYTPWNKLYRADYIKARGIRFPATFWDDFPFNLAVLRDVERVVVTDRQYYHFIRARAESETAKYNPRMYEKREEEHRWMMELYAYWNIQDEGSKEMIARRYIERVVGCIENVTSVNCKLSRPEKKREIRKIVDNPEVGRQIAFSRSRSFMMRTIVWPIRRRNVFLTFWMCNLISFVKGRSTRIFATLKSKR